MSTYNKTNNDVKINLILIQKKNIFKSFLKHYIFINIYKIKSNTNIVQIEENDCFSRIDGSWKIFHWK